MYKLCLGLVSIVAGHNAYAKTKPFIIALPSGIYSNVTESEETGDRGGIELRLYAEAKPAYVEAVVCESECDGNGRYYITPINNGFIFTWKNPRFPEDPAVTFKVWKDRKAVWIEGTEQQWERTKLKRISKPLGMIGVYKWAKP
jgi:hypothetical protein